MATIDYNAILTNEQKENLLNNRKTQFAADYFQNSLNLEASLRVGDTAAAEQSQKNLDALAIAIDFHQEELDKLATVSETPTK